VQGDWRFAFYSNVIELKTPLWKKGINKVAEKYLIIHPIEPSVDLSPQRSPERSRD